MIRRLFALWLVVKAATLGTALTLTGAVLVLFGVFDSSDDGAGGPIPVALGLAFLVAGVWLLRKAYHLVGSSKGVLGGAGPLEDMKIVGEGSILRATGWFDEAPSDDEVLSTFEFANGPPEPLVIENRQ